MSAKQKQCKRCEMTKPVEQFYKSSGAADGLYNRCISCHKKQTKKYKRNRVGNTSIDSQRIVIDEMKSNGIYACGGNGTEFTDADVVAWGCVRLEVKLAKRSSTYGAYTFSFTNRQVNDRIVGDLIVLLCDTGSGYTFHILPVTHPVFFKEDGKRKGSVTWTPGAKEKHRPGYNPTLNDDIMRLHKDYWCMIGSVLLRKVKELRTSKGKVVK